MVLRENKKGMVAIMDALIFLTILSLITVGIFSYTETMEDDEFTARSVCDDFFSIKLKACDIYTTTDTQTFRISDLISADLNTASKGDARSYIRESLEELIPPHHGYSFTLSYNDNTLEISREGMKETSSYSTEIEVTGGGLLYVKLIIM